MDTLNQTMENWTKSWQFFNSISISFLGFSGDNPQVEDIHSKHPKMGGNTDLVI